MLRMMMTALTVFISFAGVASGGIKQARAASIKDVPARVAFQQAAAYAPMGQYPKIFGSSEKQSTSLKAFTKWTGMFDRFDAALNNPGGQQSMNGFKSQLEFLRGLPMNKMISGVNDIVNRIPYVSDAALYGQTDYWATPMEFIKNGGDCEDFAITNMRAPRSGHSRRTPAHPDPAGHAENILHAVLVVYSDNGGHSGQPDQNCHACGPCSLQTDLLDQPRCLVAAHQTKGQRYRGCVLSPVKPLKFGIT